MVKTFLSFSEAATALQTDVDGLLQLFEISTSEPFPLYVRASGKPLLGELAGTYAQGKDEFIVLSDGRSIGEKLPWDYEKPEFHYNDIGDSEADVTFSFCREVVGAQHRRPVYLLRGFLRVFPEYVKQSLHNGSFLYAAVAPASWWGGHPFVPICDENYQGPHHIGQPEFEFQLADAEENEDTRDDDFAPAPAFTEAFIRSTDLLHFQAERGRHGPESTAGLDNLSPKGRMTALKLIIGMAINGYGFNPKASKSPIPKEIADALSSLGMSVTDDTVRKWLDEAATTVLPGE